MFFRGVRHQRSTRTVRGFRGDRKQTAEKISSLTRINEFRFVRMSDPSTRVPATLTVPRCFVPRVCGFHRAYEGGCHGFDTIFTARFLGNCAASREPVESVLPRVDYRVSKIRFMRIKKNRVLAFNGRLNFGGVRLMSRRNHGNPETQGLCHR